MRRRRINIRSDNPTERHKRFKELKGKIRKSIHSYGEVSEEMFQRVMDVLENSGINEDMLASIAKQSGDHTQAPIQVFTIHNEHVLDQLALQQGTYTDQFDTATHPNFAIRFPAETETIFRRMTFGDTLLLQAGMLAGRSIFTADEAKTQSNTYWKNVWAELLGLTIRGDDCPLATGLLASDGHAAFATACEFTLDVSGMENITRGQLIRTFMDERSAFYSNVKAAKERLREPNSENYVNKWRFEHVEEYDSLFMGACMIMLYGMDNYARGTQDKNFQCRSGSMRDSFNYYIRKHGITDYFDPTLDSSQLERPDPYASPTEPRPERNYPDHGLGGVMSSQLRYVPVTEQGVNPHPDAGGDSLLSDLHFVEGGVAPHRVRIDTESVPLRGRYEPFSEPYITGARSTDENDDEIDEPEPPTVPINRLLP